MGTKGKEQSPMATVLFTGGAGMPGREVITCLVLCSSHRVKHATCASHVCISDVCLIPERRCEQSVTKV